MADQQQQQKGKQALAQCTPHNSNTPVDQP